jgi:hypothetical protein
VSKFASMRKIPKQSKRKIIARTPPQENIPRSYGYIGVYSGKPEKVQVLNYHPNRLLIIDSMDRDSLIAMLVAQMQNHDYCPLGVRLNEVGDVAGGSRKLPAGNSSASSRKAAA